MSTSRSAARNTIFLSLAQGIRIVLGFALILFIANRFGATWQGKFSILLAFLNIFQVMSSFGLPRLITREVARVHDESNRYFWAGLVAQGSTTVLFAAAMFVIIALMPYPDDTKAMLRLAIVTLPMFLLYSLSAALLRAFERMQYLVYAEVLSSIAQITTAVIVLTVAPSVMALAAIRIAGLSLSALVVLASVLRMRMVRAPAIHLPFAWDLLRRSGDLFVLASLDAILQQLDILSLSIVAGESVTGIYDAAFRLVQVLLTLVMSFTEAMYPILSRLYMESRQRFGAVTGKALQYGMVALLPIAVGATVLAPQIIALLYRRPDYAASANVLAVLSWGAIVYFVMNLLSRTLVAGDRQRVSMWTTVIMMVTGLILVPALTHLLGAVGTGLGLSLMFATGAAVAWYFSRDFDLTFDMGCVARPALAAAIMGATLYFLPQLPLVVAVPAGVLVYGVFAYGLRAFDRSDIALFRGMVRR